MRQTSTRRRLVAASAAIGSGSAAGCAGGSGQRSRSNEPTAATAGGIVTDGPAQQNQYEDAHFGTLQAETINRRIEVTTDDDLVAAFDAIEPGDALILSSGTHQIDEPLALNGADFDGGPHFTIEGQGHLDTTIEATGDFPVMDLSAPRGNADRVKHVNVNQLRLTHGQSATADVVHAVNQDNYRFFNVFVDGTSTTGNNVYAEICWDWKFYACRIREGGHPERGTADVYVTTNEEGNTNSWHFVSCRIEKVVGGAIRAEHEGDGNCGRFRFTNCKFHGTPGSWRKEDVPRPRQTRHTIDGRFTTIQVVGCHFQHSEVGHIRARSGNTLLVTNNSIRGFGAPAVQVDEGFSGAAITNNEFYTKGPGYPILAAGSDVTIANNVTNQGDNGVPAQIRVTGRNATVRGNVHKGPPNDGIRVEGQEVAVVGNSVYEAGRHGVALEGASLCSVGDNVTRACQGAGIYADGDTRIGSVTGNVDAGSTGGAVTLEGENVQTSGNASGSL